MKLTHILPLTLSVVLAGCDSEGTVRPPPTDVRIFHAAPNYESVFFLREQRNEAELNFGNGTRTSFDSGSYDFHVDYFPGGGSNAARAVTLSNDLSPDRNYTFVHVSPGGDLDTLVVSTPRFEDSSATARFTLVNAHPSLGDVDIYLVAPGTMLSSVAPNGSATFGPNAAVFESAPGTYRFYITPAGTPGTVLFESTDLTITPGLDDVLVLYDDGGQNAAELLVAVVDSSVSRVVQAGLEGRVRVIQGVDDGLARDVVLDDATTALIPDLAAGMVSDYAALPTGLRTLSLTPLDTPGTAEASIEFTSIPGRFSTIVFAGNTTDGIGGLLLAEDPRPIVDQATLRLVHAAGLFSNVEVFIRAPGTDITTVNPNLSFGNPPVATPRLPWAPGEFEITLRDADTQTVLAGPEPVTFAEGGVYGIVFVNSGGGSTIDLRYLYDLAP